MIEFPSHESEAEALSEASGVQDTPEQAFEASEDARPQSVQNESPQSNGAVSAEPAAADPDSGDSFAELASPDTEVAKFEADYLKIIAQVRAKAPATRIVVANIPNVRFFKEFKSVALQNTFGRVSIALDTFINNLAATQNVAVVDLLCDPAIYLYGDLAGQLNDSAHAQIARAFLASITGTAPPPAAACAPYSLASVPAPAPGPNPFLGIYVGKYAFTDGTNGKLGFTINGDGTIAGDSQRSDGAGSRANGTIDSSGMIKLSFTNGTDNVGNFSGTASLNGQGHLIGTLTSDLGGTLTFDLTKS